MVDNSSLRFSCREAEEFDIEMPAAVIARVRSTVTVNSLPGLVPRNDNVRRSTCSGPVSVVAAACETCRKTGLAVD